MKTINALALCLACLVFSGCQATRLPSSTRGLWNPLSKLKKRATSPPTRIVAIWSHDVLNTRGQSATQGFGGRLYFYDDQNQTIPVEGQLTIHGYDDSEGSHQTGHVPDKKFIFTPEQLKQHFGKSELGSSYSIWIPWQPAGGNQRQVSLVPTFRTSTGQVLVGHQTQNLLPGKKPLVANIPEQQLASTTRRPRSQSTFAGPPTAISPTTFHQQAVATSAERHARTPNFTTTTINVPRSMTQQLQNRPLQPTGLIMPAGSRLPNTITSPEHTTINPNTGQPTAPSRVGALPTALHRENNVAAAYRPAWIPPGTPLRTPERRRPHRPTVATGSPQAPSQPVHSELYRHPVPTASGPQQDHVGH